MKRVPDMSQRCTVSMARVRHDGVRLQTEPYSKVWWISHQTSMLTGQNPPPILRAHARSMKENVLG